MLALIYRRYAKRRVSSLLNASLDLLLRVTKRRKETTILKRKQKKLINLKRNRKTRVMKR